MVSECMGQAGNLIDHFTGSPAHKESLKVFFLVLQVCHYLMAGQVGGITTSSKLLNYADNLQDCFGLNHFNVGGIIASYWEFEFSACHLCFIFIVKRILHMLGES